MQEVRTGESSLTEGQSGWSIAAGRKLLFGPAWAESSDRLVFDACSGDYWVLDQHGHAVLSSLLPPPPGGSPAPASALGSMTDDAVLARLAEVGLIEPLLTLPRD